MVTLVKSGDSPSAACCLMPARCLTSNSSSDKHSLYHDSFPDVSDVIMSHLRTSSSVLKVGQLLSRYGRSNGIAYTTAKHSLCVVASLCSESLIVRVQYSIHLFVRSFRVWSSTPPSCFSQASKSMVYCLFARRKKSIAGSLVFFERMDRLYFGFG